MVFRLFGETDEDEVRDEDAPSVKLSLDELEDGDEDDEGANEGGEEGDLELVGHARKFT